MLDARRTLFFTAEQVFLWMVAVWSMHKADGQTHSTGKQSGGQRAEKTFMFKFFSCLAIEYEFISHSNVLSKKIDQSV